LTASRLIQPPGEAGRATSTGRGDGTGQQAPRKPKGGVLDPVDRLSEVIFGLIMAMTFTGSVHAATAGRAEIHTMLFEAIGCNIAWGIVDATMFLLTGLVGRDHSAKVLRKLASTAGSPEARRILLGELPDAVGGAASPDELDRLGRWLVSKVQPTARVQVRLADLRGALGVFLLVSLSTFPLVVPFLVLSETVLAVRASHAIAVAGLFACGASLARYSGQRPLAMGGAMAGIGLVLVAVTIALGG